MTALNSLVIVVVAMAVVTYIPRMLPITLLDRTALSPGLKRFLEFIPYAVLASLIFPEVLTSVQPLSSAIIGAVTAFILAWLRLNLVLVVLGSILAVFLTGWFPV